jgi:hypothetical protein
MKKQSTTLKKTTDSSNVKLFWTKEYQDLVMQARKIEDEVLEITERLDCDGDIQGILGKDRDALKDEKSKQEAVRSKNIEQAWSEVNRLKSVVAELKRGKVKRGSQELGSMASEIMAYLDEQVEADARELSEYVEENKLLARLEKEVKDVDRVKGFDEEEEIDMKLLIDFGGFENAEGAEEQKMIENYYSGYEMMQEKVDIELQTVAQNDVREVQPASGSVQVHRRHPRRTQGAVQPLLQDLHQGREVQRLLVQHSSEDLSRDQKGYLGDL